MLTISLWLNVVVLVPVIIALLANGSAISRAFGERTAARGILLSIYLSILAVSIVALFATGVRAAAPALLLVQVLYKVTTPLTVGTLKNPVVITNLFVAAVHLVTLASSGWP